MELDADLCYKALQCRDARFDGAFFVAVRTTGIYCRPVCKARTPRSENCRFFACAAAAEKSGFRPCLRCRPELAPGRSQAEAGGGLAARAFRRIEEGALSEIGVEDLAHELGVCGRQLRRAVEQAYGVSPVALAQTQRLLLAKRLLTDTAMTVTEVTFASGFSSMRRFQTLFRNRYRLTPTDLRRSQAIKEPALTLFFELAYRPPFDWDALLDFLAGRASSGVETREETRYLRTVRIGEHKGWIAVQPMKGRSAFQVEMSSSLTPVLPQVLSRTRRLFDLDTDMELIEKHLGPLASAHPSLRVPGAFDGFEVAVRTVLGQQVSVKAASTLATRLSASLGEPIETPFPQLTHLFPTPAILSGAELVQLTSLGILPARAATIRTLSREVAAGRIGLDHCAEVEAAMTALKALPGIGEWTAQYITMRTLGWPDAFPHTDLGIKKALSEYNPRQLLARAEQWRPWRSYAAMHLWKSLEATSC